MKKRAILTLIAVGLVSTGSPAPGQTIGNIRAIYADPSDAVVELDVRACSARFFHIQRAQPNFREMVDLMVAAYAARRPVGLFVRGCIRFLGQSRPLVSHGFIIR